MYYIYMYIYMCIYIYVYIYVYIYMCVYIYMHLRMLGAMYVYMWNLWESSIAIIFVLSKLHDAKAARGHGLPGRPATTFAILTFAPSAPTHGVVGHLGQAPFTATASKSLNYVELC